MLEQLNELPANPEITLPTETNLYVFLSNTINNQTFYYLSGINCLANEDQSLASNALELRALVLNPSILKELRIIRNWGTSNTLSSFLSCDRNRILELIYGRAELGRLASDWIKLFLLGTENYNVYLVNKDTGETSEVLFIKKIDMERFFEVTKTVPNKPY